jgi:hypothetical protein
MAGAPAVSVALTTCATPVGALASDDHGQIAALHRVADAIAALTARLNADPGATEGEWDAWRDREGALLREVVALPATRENAAIKARAVGMMYDGRWSDFEGNGTFDLILAAQVLRALAGSA